MMIRLSPTWIALVRPGASHQIAHAGNCHDILRPEFSGIRVASHGTVAQPRKPPKSDMLKEEQVMRDLNIEGDTTRVRQQA